MEWLTVGLGLLLVLVVAAKLLKKRSPFPKPPQGERLGTWAFSADPESQRVKWKLDLPPEHHATLAAHFTQWQLFYLGNGSRRADGSAELRAAIEKLLRDPDDCPWRDVDVLPRSKATLDFEGELYEGAGFVSFPGVIGVPRQAESRAGAALTLVRHVLAMGEPHASRLRRALERMLRFHEEHGPPASIAEVGPRAYAALSESPG